MHFIGAHLAEFYINSAKSLFIMAGVCFALEMIFPATRYSARSYVRGMRNWLINIAFAAVVWRASTLIFEWSGFKPIFSINLGQLLHTDNRVLSIVGAIVSGVTVAMIGDFFYYWLHRAQHAIPFLWRFHSMHHSIRELTAFNCNQHVTEPIFYLPFVTLPLTLVHFDSGVVPAVAMFFIGLQPYFEHASTRLHLGPLRYVFGDPRFHRIHHSLDRKHWHVNFGSFTTIWDQLFRTALFPERGEWPAVGLEDQPEPKTVRDFLLRPIMNLRHQAPGAIMPMRASADSEL